MKVLFIDDTPCWIHSLPWGLENLGHQVKILTEIREDSLTRALKDFRPDLVFTVGWGRLHGKDNLKTLRKVLKAHGAFHAYWTVEDIDNIETWSIPYVKRTEPDLVFTINGSCLHRYQEMGIPAAFLDFGCNPVIHHNKEPQKEYSADIAMVAHTWEFWINYRAVSMNMLLRPLLNKGYDLAVWGKGWRQVPEEVDFRVPEKFLRGSMAWEETAKVFSSAKIVLAPQNEYRFTTQVAMRTFEIMGSQGFMISPRTTALEKMFTNGKHLMLVDTPEQTLEVVKYYLKHPEEREAIAKEGQAEVYRNHTYIHRAKQVVEVVKSLRKDQGVPGKYCEPYPQFNRREGVFFPGGEQVVAVSTGKSRRDDKVMYLGAMDGKKGRQGAARAYWRFNLNQLPGGVEIMKARLRLWCSEGYGQKLKVALFPVEEPWQPGKLAWDKRPETPEKPLGLAKLPAKHPDWVTWEVTGLAREWWLGQRHNHGIMLALWPQANEKDHGVTLLAGGWPGHKWFRPQLVVEYR
ncbi:MAG: glycosyltransferase [Clostridia bacterium]|nr:glycosyltransferase [Clostridia bacterium]